MRALCGLLRLRRRDGQQALPGLGEKLGRSAIDPRHGLVACHRIEVLLPEFVETAPIGLARGPVRGEEFRHELCGIGVGEAWRDPLKTWTRDTAKKQAAGVAIDLELIEGVALMRRALERFGDRPEEANRLSRILEAADPAQGGTATAAERLALLQRQQPVLTVSNLSVTFPVKKFFFGRKHTFVRAVDDVSLQVYPGETLGLVGESGSGKTTLGKSILQLIRPDAGSVNYKGNELTKLSHAELQPIRRQLQIIFQDPYASLNPRLTVGQAIIEPMTVHRLYASDTERKEKAVELLKKVNMPEESFNRFPHQFSGGQRQRICIARALSLNPDFIVCDECVSSLDVSVQAQVLNLLMQLREEFQLSYIFISHDLAVVRFMSDRIIVMNNGRIAESGTADTIYHHPASEYTKKLISAVPAGIVSTKA